MKREKEKVAGRLRRHRRVRNNLAGTPERPRLSVFRSHKNIYCQIIDDTVGKTLVALSTLSPELRGELTTGGNVKAALVLGERLAKKAVERGLASVAFDRGGYRYHGRVKAVAEAARKAGLKF